MESAPRARLAVLAAAGLFSTGGAAIKATGLTGWQVAAFRSGTAALALALLLPAVRRGWTWRTWLVGLAYAATLLLYVLANKLTTAANAIFLQSTAPLFLLLLSPWLLRESVRRRDVLFLLALAAGLALFFAGLEPPQRTAPDPALGNLLAGLSALSWALTVAGLRWLGRAEVEVQGRAQAGPALGATVAGNLLVFLLALPFALPVRGSAPLDWALVGWLGVFQIGLAYVFLTNGVRRVPALEVSLLLLLEPVLNTVWAFLVHGERPGPRSLLGGGVILLATAWHAVRSARRTPPRTVSPSG
jgi:drug/metabolite transporter (DMT)-like permease